ncbi:MAG: hypothetical protein FWF79_08210 [Defluviitaleaceae bacterium]|nr:hypothetical protein [Defluviitaleaceae bacterium]
MLPETSRLMRCRKCDTKFEPVGLESPLCPLCQQAKDEQYIVVRELVREYPGITALEVHEATEVPMHVILRYIENGMLEAVKDRGIRDDEISERIGLLIKRAKERKEIFSRAATKHAAEAEAQRLDEMRVEDDKFTWILKATPEN